MIIAADSNFGQILYDASGQAHTKPDSGVTTEITAACRRPLRAWLQSLPAKIQLMPWVGGNGERS
jgi:hypothetical protein